jgi:hypothetical protein
MKRLMRFLILSAGLCIQAALATAETAPRIVVDEPEFHFGMQVNTQTIEHTFVVRNEGTAALNITRIRSSCGCTVGNVSAREVEPGSSSEITASYNLRGREGSQRSVLTLETNDPDQPQTRLIMSGTAVREMEVQPGRVFFGPLLPGQTARQQVEIRGVPEQPFQLRALTVDQPAFRLVATEALAPHQYQFTIEVAASAHPAQLQGTFQIETSHPRLPVIRVPLHAEISGALSFAPSRITLVADQPHPVTRYIVVRPVAVSTFEITDIMCPDPETEIHILALPNQGYRIQLTNLRALPILAANPLRIFTTAESMPVIEIPFELIEPPQP